jgi:hypothetical protein
MSLESNVNIIKEYGTLFPKFLTYVKNKKGLNYNQCKAFSTTEVKTLMTDYLKSEVSWDKSGNKTSFNQIQKLRMGGVVKEIVRNTSSNFSYFELENDFQFYIRKQDEFHFILVCGIYKYLKKNKHNELLEEFFIETNEDLIVDPNLVHIETSEKTKDGNHYRTDMSFEIKSKHDGKSRIIVVEYLEKQHERDKDLDYPFERHRALNLMFGNKSTDKEIVHISYFWDRKYNDEKYFKTFVKKICKLMVDYWDIADKDKYSIRKLTEIVKNKTLAEQLYLAHTNRNEPVVNIEVLESIINWNKNLQIKKGSTVSRLWYNEFVDKVKKYVFEFNKANKVIDDFDDFDDDDDNDFDNDDDNDNDNSNNSKDSKNMVTHEKFYKVIGDEIYLTQAGLHLYISVEQNYLTDISEYFKLRKFYEDITQGLVDILNEYRLKELDLKNQLISGLE